MKHLLIGLILFPTLAFSSLNCLDHKEKILTNFRDRIYSEVDMKIYSLFSQYIEPGGAEIMEVVYQINLTHLNEGQEEITQGWIGDMTKISGRLQLSNKAKVRLMGGAKMYFNLELVAPHETFRIYKDGKVYNDSDGNPMFFTCFAGFGLEGKSEQGFFNNAGKIIITSPYSDEVIGEVDLATPSDFYSNPEYALFNYSKEM